MYPARAGNGIAMIRSRYSVDDTAARLKDLLEARGIKIFAIVDHSGEAERAGLRMPNTKLVIFGNPQGGTPLMLAAPTLALDLPLKILVFEESGSNVWMAFNTAEYLSNRHNLPAELSDTLAAVSAIANQIAE